MALLVPNHLHTLFQCQFFSRHVRGTSIAITKRVSVGVRQLLPNQASVVWLRTPLLYLFLTLATHRLFVGSMIIKTCGQVVGHVPRSFARYTHFFLHRQGNQIVREVTGSPVNRGVGLGLEVPCFYHFDGHQNFIRKLQESLKE